MDATEVKQEIWTYWTDSDGLVGLQRDPQPRGCENGILFLSEFIVLCQKLGILEESDIARYVATIKSCERFFNGSKILGLYNRAPNRLAPPEQHDDYVGIVAASYLCDLSFHNDIYEFGKKYGWCYNNVEPYVFDIKFVRQGSNVAFYTATNGKYVMPWLSLWEYGGLLTAVLKPTGDTSSKLLAWLELEALASKSVKWKAVKAMWMGLLRARNKGGMVEVFEIYFQDHPLVALAKLAFA